MKHTHTRLRIQSQLTHTRLHNLGLRSQFTHQHTIDTIITFAVTLTPVIIIAIDITHSTILASVDFKLHYDTNIMIATLTCDELNN